MIDCKAIFNAENAQVEVRQIALDQKTAEVAAALCDLDRFVLLDSSETDRNQGRFSIFAWEPKLIFSSKGTRSKIRFADHWAKHPDSPLELLDCLLRASTIRTRIPEELPMAGGAIGYLSYDLFPLIERFDRLTAKDDLELPDCILGFYDSVLIRDNLREQWWLAATSIFADSPAPAEMISTKEKQLRNVLSNPRTVDKPDPGEAHSLQSNFTRVEYLNAVEKAVQYIFAGEIYQVNLSQRFHTTLTENPFAFYLRLRKINPCHYGAYLRHGDFSVISVSPELFVKRTGDQLETRPIKGTRRRGRDETEDLALRRDLLNSPKDLAELSMIVDLQRNDLGRVCRYGTVAVRQHAYVESLPTVHHTISTVTGTIRDEVGTVDLLRATFPGGSITGCPKIRSMEIIDELEPTCRNVYTGSIGYLAFNGDLSLNIAIRTILTKGAELFFQVGGGIVADSDPESEYQETLDKAAAFFTALRAKEPTDGL
jgi:para-aminobenzoate synthetase component I